MDSIRQIKLSYKEDFRIACMINHLNYKSVLQYFVDHVSFYVFIGGNMASAYIWATAVCVECREAIGEKKEPVKDQHTQQVSLKHIKLLAAVIADSDLTDKIAKSKSVMKEWSAEMPKLQDYFHEIMLANEGSLQLSFDFNLLCSLNGISVQNLLQYFIDHISLARERAVNLLQIVKTDPSTSLLLSLASADQGDQSKILPKQNIYRAYGLRLLKLDKKQKEESNIENRIVNYSVFYLDWYHALID